MELLNSYFPDLTQEQLSRFLALKELYIFWNEQINVISRKDMDYFYERHVLHSLGIAKVHSFEPSTKILDVGTGGGFPGIPLAILFPESNFLLVDSIGKKIKVVNEVANSLSLTNVEGMHLRAEEVKGQFDFIVSRAVTQMPTFVGWVENKISKVQKSKMKNGILYLKGGDLSEELQGVRGNISEYFLSNYFQGDFFETKKVIHWSK